MDNHKTSQAIWKFPLPQGQHPVVAMPIGAQPVSVAIDPASSGEKVAVWARVWPDARPVLRRFEICGTGHPCPDIDDASVEFLGTVVTTRGFVWHVFDCGTVTQEI